jgi:hypothetical protein
MKEKRSRKFTVRFTETEYKALETKFRQTTSNQLSHYLRQVALNKTVTVKYRNMSLDDCMEELIALRRELNAVGGNLNQAVKRLHTLRQIAEFREWLTHWEPLQQEIAAQIKSACGTIAKMSETWWSE